MNTWKKYIFGNWNWKRPFYSFISIYLLLLIAVIFFANKLIFFPPASNYGENLDGFQFLTSRSNDKVAIIYKKALNNKPTILWSHGNAEDISSAQAYMETLRNKGYGYLIYDYPGYGLSKGSPSEAGCNRNIEASWKHLTKTLSIPTKDIFLVGQSVGSGPSVWLAEKNEPIGGLILISPFKSINRVPFSINPFPYDRFSNINKIATVNAPLLVMHGDKDNVINHSHGKALHEKHQGRKTLHISEGSGHNDMLANKQNNAVMFQFITKHYKK